MAGGPSLNLATTQVSDDVPGPGAYAPRVTTAPGVKFGSARRKHMVRESAPGPGTYS